MLDGQADNSDLQALRRTGRQIITRTLSFPEFISTHQKRVYSIHFFVRYSQFQSPAARVGTTIYDHVHPNIFESTFNFDKFVSTCKKSGVFIILLQRYLIQNPRNLIGQEHSGPYLSNQNFPKYEICLSIQQLV